MNVMQHYFLCTKVDTANRTLTFSNGKKKVTRKIFASVKVTDGTIYLTGDTKVAVWDRDVLGRSFEKGSEFETWSSLTLRESRQNFIALCKSFAVK